MAPRGKVAVAKPWVEKTIKLKPEWFEKQATKKLKFFLPDWDDRIDPGFDFKNERHSGGMSSWTNEVYAHQVYAEPPYDGLLLSRLNMEESVRKNAAILASGGVHAWYRVPKAFPILGDCGAFGYIKDDEPPFTSEECLEYYLKFDFSMGVSVDHVIVSATEDERQKRFDITLANAEEFLRAWKASGEKQFTPIGAIQGWNKKSHIQAAESVVAMGYGYIAIGGLVRSHTKEARRIVRAVMDVVPKSVKVHVFGIGRLSLIRDFKRWGVASIDSASYLRKAWLKETQNFLTQDDGWYSSIRVPPSDMKKAKTLIASGKITLEQLEDMEKRALIRLRNHDRHDGPPARKLLDVCERFDELLTGKRRKTMVARVEKTLNDRPWRKCGCTVCAKWGVEVAIFRGSNRNRRRAWHNVYVFYCLMQRILAGETIPWLEKERMA